MCHGVLAATAPHARVIDLTHAIQPGDVAQGAWSLSRAVTHLPVAVHLAVVDPGVGTARRPVAVRSGRGDLLVGPDNGVLGLAAEVLGGVTGAWELSLPAGRRVSATFHGRDIFAPAAGALAAGTTPEDLGPPVAELVSLPVPVVRSQPEDGTLAGEVTLVDRFGNVQLAAPGALLGELGVHGGDEVAVVTAGTRAPALVVRTFGELPAGDLGVYEDSDGLVALAINGGSAAVALRVHRGDVVAIHRRA